MRSFAKFRGRYNHLTFRVLGKARVYNIYYIYNIYNTCMCILCIYTCISWPGQGRFVELRAGDRLLVGAETQEMADQLVEEWRQRRERHSAALKRSFMLLLKGFFALKLSFNWLLKGFSSLSLVENDDFLRCFKGFSCLKAAFQASRASWRPVWLRNALRLPRFRGRER